MSRLREISLSALAAFIAGCTLGGVAMVVFTGLALRALGWH